MLSLKELKKRLPGSPSGCVCKFVKINDEIGIKVYEDSYIRDENYTIQKQAAEHGLAPPVVGEPFKVGGYYCFTTRVAAIVVDGNMISEMDWDEFDSLQSKYKQQINDLVCELMDAIGWEFTDDHICNIGYYNGKLVCIDFGNG